MVYSGRVRDKVSIHIGGSICYGRDSHHRLQVAYHTVNEIKSLLCFDKIKSLLCFDKIKSLLCIYKTNSLLCYDKTTFLIKGSGCFQATVRTFE